MSISTSTTAATLEDLRWMVGSWIGSFGSHRVEEAWSEPRGGSMSTMIRLTSETDTVMIELIVIREQDDSMVLHLRQFDPSLQLLLAQDMPLASLTPGGVTFVATGEAAITRLTYRHVSQRRMEVDLTTADGTVVTAALQRSSEQE